ARNADRSDAVAFFLQSVDDFLDMFDASRLEGELDGGLAKGRVAEAPLVRALEDVGLEHGDEAGEACQRAGTVRDDDLEAHEPSVLLQPAVDDAADDVDVDVAARDQGAGALVAGGGDLVLD